MSKIINAEHCISSIPQGIAYHQLRKKLYIIIYCLSSALYSQLKEIDFTHISDLESYAVIVDWLYNIDPSMNLTPKISLSDLWAKAENHSLKTVSSLMYSAFCGNKDEYSTFVTANLQRIIGYLKRKTNSHKLQVSDDNKEIKVEYLLRASEITKGNNESVSRLGLVFYKSSLI